MRKLLIASLLFASAGTAAAQPEPTKPEGGTAEGAPAGGEAAPAATTEVQAEVAPAEPQPAPEEPKKDEKPAVTAKYDGGLKLSTEDKEYALKLAFRNQVRFESTRPLEDGSQFANKFYIPRARFQAEGHVFGADNRFKAELGMGDSGSFSFLKDFFLEKKLPDSPVVVRFGQWKRPFSRLEIVSDFASELNERSIANELAGGGRDLGIAAHNEYEKSPEGIEWAIGVFNGFSGGSDRPRLPIECETDMGGVIVCDHGRPSTFGSDFGPTVVARAGWNSANAKGYSEGDLEGGPLRYSVGASYKIDLANFSDGGKPSLADNLSHGLELDWNIKAQGLSFSGMVVMMKLKDADPEYGLAVQPGYFVVPKQVQVVGRFGFTTDGPSDDRNELEALGGFNYYFHGHNMKIATDFGILKTTGSDPTTNETDDPDIRIRVMGQLQL